MTSTVSLGPPNIFLYFLTKELAVFACFAARARVRVMSGVWYPLSDALNPVLAFPRAGGKNMYFHYRGLGEMRLRLAVICTFTIKVWVK